MLTIVALLTIRDATAFDLFERQAVAIMKAHGGSLVSAFRPRASDSARMPAVDEVHVLKFPDQEAFDRYRSDTQLAALAPLREKAISHTSVYESAQELDYSSPKSSPNS